MATKRKKILLGVKARNKLIEGVDFLADALQSTLGPHGQNFALEKGEKVTNDGRNIAVEMEHPDEVANRGLILMRKASVQTEQEVKDASTTTVVLGRAILKEGLTKLPTESVSIGKLTTSELIEQIERERIEISEKLDKMAEPVETKEQLIEVVTVSSEDKELGRIIAETQWELGKEGFLIADEHIGKTHEVEKVKGLLLDNGLANTQVINNQEKQSLDLKDSRIILTSNTVETIKVEGEKGMIRHTLPIEGLVTQLYKSGVKHLVFMARAFTTEAIQLCWEYSKQGFNIYPVNGPYVDMVEIMKDLQAIHGGRFVNAEEGSLATIGVDDVGFAESLSVERYRSVFAGKDDEASKERIEKRILELKDKLKGKISDFEKDNLERRISQLSSGCAIIKVGAILDTTRKRLKDKADDAVGTARIALQEGVVKGGGLALKEIADELPDSYLLKKPLRVIYEQIISTAPTGFVIEPWVKDPVKTIKVALKYACEAASNIATAAGVITTAYDKPRLVEFSDEDEDVT